MKDLYEVTWQEGANYCFIDGVELSPEHAIKLCGYEGEWDCYDDDFKLNGQCLYTDITNLYEIVKLFGEYHEPIKEYDMIANKGYGRESHYEQQKLNNCLVIHDAERLKDIVIKPMGAFKEDYPNYNHEAYLKIMDSLDYYYKHMNNE
jgi:hypothetical protein